MGTPYMGEIRLLSFNFPPKGWAMCNGQLLPINQNQALFSLMGTTYGGDGRTTFALPDLRSRVPIHAGNGHTQGERAGQQTVTLSIAQMPAHVHQLRGATSLATTSDPTGASFAQPSAALGAVYNTAADTPAALAPAAVANTGGNQPHENMQPYLTLSFCVALQGIFPSRL